MPTQMQETTTAATRDKPAMAIDHFAKPAASLTGNMVMRRSMPGAAPAPVRPVDGAPAGREEWLTGPVRTVLAGLRAWGSRRVSAPVTAGAIFVYAYFFFVMVLFAGLDFMPDLLFPQ